MTQNIKEKQMAILSHEFQLLSKTVLSQMKNISEIIRKTTVDKKIYEDIESNEIIIDRLEVQIREEIIFAIFKFNPVATDLRLIISYQDAATNLERIGDMLLNIAHILQRHHSIKDGFPEVRELLLKMMTTAFEMVENAIIIFLNAEPKTAYDVILKDNEVDELFHQLNILLQNKYVQNKFKDKDVLNIINASAISQNLERIADCATNIAETVIFITEGKNIRHEKK